MSKGKESEPHLACERLEPQIRLGVQIGTIEPRKRLSDPLSNLAHHALLCSSRTQLSSDVDERAPRCAQLGRVVRRQQDRLAEVRRAPVEVPLLYAAEVGAVRGFGDGAQMAEDELLKRARVSGVRGSRAGPESTYLHMLPVLHHHDIHLISDDNLNRAQKVGIAVLLNGQPEPEGASHNHVRVVPAGKRLPRLARQLGAKAKRVVAVAPQLFRARMLACFGRVGVWAKLALEALCAVVRLAPAQRVQQLAPAQRGGAQRQQNENRRAREALVARRDERRSGRGGVR